MQQHDQALGMITFTIFLAVAFPGLTVEVSKVAIKNKQPIHPKKSSILSPSIKDF